MIYIAICDDDIVEGKKIDQLVEDCGNELKAVYKKNVFSSSKALLYEIEDGTNFDLLLLDIEMPELDGIELTTKLRQFLPDALVIFVTSYEKYVYDSFKVQPYRFVPKRRIDEMLPAAVKDALNLIIQQDDKYYVVENQRTLEKVPIKHITHIWHRGKYAYVEKSDGTTVKVRKSLKQVYEELASEDFMLVGRGCILNISKIEKITGDHIILVSGTRLDVNKDRLAELKKTVRDYWIAREGLK